MKNYFIILIILLNSIIASTFNLNLKGITDNVSFGFLIRKQLRGMIFSNDDILNHSFYHLTKMDCEIDFVYGILLTSTLILSFRDEKYKRIYVLRNVNLKILEVIILTITIIMSKNVSSVS